MNNRLFKFKYRKKKQNILPNLGDPFGDCEFFLYNKVFLLVFCVFINLLALSSSVSPSIFYFKLIYRLTILFISYSIIINSVLKFHLSVPTIFVLN